MWHGKSKDPHGLLILNMAKPHAKTAHEIENKNKIPCGNYQEQTCYVSRY
jgi:hypothetical protein